MQRDLECDGVHEETLRLIAPGLITNLVFLEYCEEYFARTTEDDKADMAFAESCLNQIDFQYDYNVPFWLEAEYETARDDAWDNLYEQGKIGTSLAVPCRWHESVHGPGTAEAYPCSIEDCNAVWIPAKDDIDNIKANIWPAGASIEWKGALGSTKEPLHAVVTVNGKVVLDTPKWKDAQAYVDAYLPTPSYTDLYNAAVKYAKGCLDEFVKYCNGECYGTVVETFQREGDEWVLVESDHCWGHIGYDYAEEALKELFTYHCNTFLKEAA
jgi:hypothetical protein